MDPVLDFEFTVIKQRIRRAWAVVGIAGVIALVALGTSLRLDAATARRRQGLSRVSAAVDTLSRDYQSDSRALSPLETKLASLGTLEQRVSGELGDKVDRRMLLALGARLDDVSAHLARSDSALAELGQRLDRGLSAERAARTDSLVAVRAALAHGLADVRTRLGGEDRLLAADQVRLEGLDESEHHDHRLGLVGDGMGAVGISMITAHVLDHSGR